MSFCGHHMAPKRGQKPMSHTVKAVLEAPKTPLISWYRAASAKPKHRNASIMPMNERILSQIAPTSLRCGSWQEFAVPGFRDRHPIAESHLPMTFSSESCPVPRAEKNHYPMQFLITRKAFFQERSRGRVTEVLIEVC